jgi:multidrug efflux pump subunit AcrB
VPLGGASARCSAQWMRGLSNDVYCQVGSVMLIGLAAKNAILIVEFAEQHARPTRGLSTIVELRRETEAGPASGSVPGIFY